MTDTFFAIAPTDQPKRRNTLREPLVPFASWQLDDSHFAFDSSLLLPSMTKDLADLAVLVRAHAGAKLSIFGHADPSGRDDYNKILSGRRAMALYALLTRRVDLWEQLYKAPHGGDDWQKQDLAAGTMRAHLGESAGKGTTAGQRAALFDSYMTSICRDGEDKSFGLPKSAFLGAGADAKGKADYQGCGEFNPLVVFSRAEAAEFARPERRPERNEANAPNRRVTVFFFAKGTTVEVSKWPCPRAGEGPAACRKRFWSDAAARRSNQTDRRTHPAARDTFACRFYDRLGLDAAPGTTRLLLCQLHDPLRDPVPNVAAFVGAGGDAELEVRSDGEGWVSCMVPVETRRVAIRYTAPSTGVEYVVAVDLPPRTSDDDAIYLAHIRNLGYSRDGEAPRATLLRFQAGFAELELTGVLDPPTKARVDRLIAEPLRSSDEASDG